MADKRDCPLCGEDPAEDFSRDHRRTYLRCEQCRLIFTPARFHLDGEEEKRHYDCHENHPADAGYRRFLSRLYEPLNQRLSPGSTGLDFGCGPGPTLSLMFEEAGHRVEIYDVNYAPDKQVLNRHYDFITASEVVEHLASPGAELDRLWRLLRAGGWLGIMTKLALDLAAFNTWHYKNDPTHIVFFSRDTFICLGARWEVTPEFIGSDVILFQK